MIGKIIADLRGGGLLLEEIATANTSKSLENKVSSSFGKKNNSLSLCFYNVVLKSNLRLIKV